MTDATINILCRYHKGQLCIVVLAVMRILSAAFRKVSTSTYPCPCVFTSGPIICCCVLALAGSLHPSLPPPASFLCYFPHCLNSVSTGQWWSKAVLPLARVCDYQIPVNLTLFRFYLSACSPLRRSYANRLPASVSHALSVALSFSLSLHLFV